MSEYTKENLKIVIAKICQSIGWNSITSSSLEVLVDILHLYLSKLSTLTHAYSTHYGHSEPNLDDLGLALRDMKVEVEDLALYIQNTNTPPARRLPLYPVKKMPILKLNFSMPDSHEILNHSLNIHEYLPPVPPKEEDNDLTAIKATQNKVKSATDLVAAEKLESTDDTMKERTITEENTEPKDVSLPVTVPVTKSLIFDREGRLPMSFEPYPASSSEQLPVDSLTTCEQLPTKESQQKAKKKKRKNKKNKKEKYKHNTKKMRSQKQKKKDKKT